MRVFLFPCHLTNYNLYYNQPVMSLQSNLKPFLLSATVSGRFSANCGTLLHPSSSYPVLRISSTRFFIGSQAFSSSITTTATIGGFPFTTHSSATFTNMIMFWWNLSLLLCKENTTIVWFKSFFTVNLAQLLFMASNAGVAFRFSVTLHPVLCYHQPQSAVTKYILKETWDNQQYSNGF